MAEIDLDGGVRTRFARHYDKYTDVDASGRAVWADDNVIQVVARANGLAAGTVAIPVSADETTDAVAVVAARSVHSELVLR
jgi:hypothetical protein